MKERSRIDLAAGSGVPSSSSPSRVARAGVARAGDGPAGWMLLVVVAGLAWGCGGETGSADSEAEWQTRLSAGREARSLDQHALAESLFAESIRAAQHFAAGDSRRFHAFREFAATMAAERRYEEADSLYAAAMQVRSVDVAETTYAAALEEWADVAHALRARPRADSLLAVSIERGIAARGEEDPRVVERMQRLSWFALGDGRFAEAESLYERTLDLTRRVYGDDDPRVADVLLNLALTQRRQRELESAEASYLRALSISERSDGPESERVAMVLINYATFLKRMGRNPEAKAALQRAQEIRTALQRAEADAP